MKTAMEVHVRFFATLRDIVGRPDVTMAVEEGTTLGELVGLLEDRYPGLRPHRDTLLMAVDREFEGAERELRGGEEVALMPPVSGGIGEVRIQEQPLDATAALDSVRREDCGAVALFVGIVRADPGVRGLEYEAYDEMAQAKLEEIRSLALKKFDVEDMALHHRKGRLRVGEDAVVIAVAAGHRGEAFEACRWAIEQVKRVVPIWKVREIR